MNFNEKLKAMRKQAGFSQEQLAEKLNVSRQAITKWEADNGLPDIDNLVRIAKLFRVTLDDLVVHDTVTETNEEYAFESVTEYDIEEIKHYDIHVGGANIIIVGACEKEKIRVRLASNILENLDKALKVKIEEKKDRMDIAVKNNNVYTVAQAKEALSVFIELPKQIGHAEMKAIAPELILRGLAAETFEVEGKVSKVKVEGFHGTLELDSSMDMDIRCEALEGSIAINQISATSVISVPKGTRYRVVKKGRTNKVSYTLDNMPSIHEDAEDAAAVIELAGMRSELIVNEYSIKESSGDKNE